MEWETALGGHGKGRPYAPHPRAGEPVRPPARRRGGTPAEAQPREQVARPAQRSASEIDLAAPRERQQPQEQSSAPTHETIVSDQRHASDTAQTERREEAEAIEREGPRHAATEPSEETSGPEWGQDAQARAERERPFNFDGPHTTTHDHAAEPPSGHTEAQSSAAAPVEHADAATQAQSADDSGAATVDVQYADTSAQAAGAMAAANTGFGPTETEYRPHTGQRVYDKSLGELPDAAPPATDTRSVLKALTQLLAFAVEGRTSHLAPDRAPLECAVSVCEDWQGARQWRVFSNAGYGVVPPGVQVPSICDLGFETGIGLTLAWPEGRRAHITHAVIGVQSAMEIAYRDYQFRQANEAAQGRRLALLGIGTTGAVPVEAHRALIETAGRALGGNAPDPEIVAAAGVAREPANADPALASLTHPLYKAAESLAERLDIAQTRMDWHQQIGVFPFPRTGELSDHATLAAVAGRVS
ncbi:hypothetical protein [Segniliparus rugosus]|uniref:Uncharacterized protein n=1 Tax=Segniliparus rugosus (strain ATCC BAA-974 / DSM 45345 / CCUG 50838 / CIP 108380 / JCM 13579 / CDC 945) TaxID=679197 RepID=U1N9E9_SEGRC|nr:hypothetical protein [Segniliparus rugosus]ERG69418.1 hypothetical protein HMPREF9336_04114 [Segniliparus rugosus ATCC BAA-974]